MASQVQIKANRRNAQKSTGPASPEGKAKSRFNSLKSGIYAKSEVIPGEDPAELEVLDQDYREEYHPHTPTQIALVDSLISGDWLQRRLRQSVARLWQEALEGGADVGPAYQNNPAIDRAIGRMEGLKRTYHRDVWRLVEIRKEEAQAAADAAEAAAREQKLADDRFKAAAVADHARLVGMLLVEKDDDGTPLYTREEAQYTASYMQEYEVRTVAELDVAMDAECLQEEEGEAGPAAPALCGEAVAQASDPQKRRVPPALPAGEPRTCPQGADGISGTSRVRGEDACPTGKGSELGSFRSSEEDSVNGQIRGIRSLSRAGRKPKNG